jgi:hypothetical protein
MKKLQPDKLDSKAEKCFFVGYPWETIGYTFFHPAEGKTFIAKAGTFLEKQFLAKGISGKKVELGEIVDPSLKISSRATEDVRELPLTEQKGADNEDYAELAKKTERRSTWIRKSPKGFGNPVLTILLVEHDEPTTYTKAMEAPSPKNF